MERLVIIYVSIYVLKQWVALKARSDWLLKLPISFASHLRGTPAGFSPENIAIVAGINDFKSSFLLYYLIVYSID